MTVDGTENLSMIDAVVFVAIGEHAHCSSTGYMGPVQSCHCGRPRLIPLDGSIELNTSRSIDRTIEINR